MIYSQNEYGVIYNGDCLNILKEFEDNSIDSIITDPPYGISFMNKKWDYDIPSVNIFEECLRVLKPGGYLLSFSSTRTQHRMATNIEDAGFTIKDMLAWIYGSGLTKSTNIGKKLNNDDYNGIGTALKPAFEPITMAKKPISEKNIAQNILKYKTGGINIDKCRIKSEDSEWIKKDINEQISNVYNYYHKKGIRHGNKTGRFPANIIHDGSDDVLDIFPNVNGVYELTKPASETNTIYHKFGKTGQSYVYDGIKDTGSAARFFYCAKASRSEREAGCENVKQHADESGQRHNSHPTVKPIALMQYLCRLVTPENGIVLDPFFGSGSTGCAAIKENLYYIGIEIDKHYCDIAKHRIDHEIEQLTLF